MPFILARLARAIFEPKATTQMPDTNSTVPAQVAEHMIADHIRRADHLRVGPFVGSLDSHTASLGRNYATPLNGARPTSAEIADLVSAFERHDRIPRLEYVANLAPQAEAALRAAGFTIDQRLAMLACRRSSVIDRAVPPGIDIFLANSADDLLDAAAVQQDAYGEPEPAGPHDVDRLQALLGRGGLIALARDAETGEACGAGLVTETTAAVAEVAAVATAETYRRRGIASSLASLLTRSAHDGGAIITFLDVEGPQEEAVYLGIGYARAGERVWITKR